MSKLCEAAQVPHTFILSDEERYALIDIVRYGNVNAVSLSLRDNLLLSFAKMAVLSIYGKDHQLKPEDLESSLEIDAGDCPLAVQFISMRSLSKNNGAS